MGDTLAAMRMGSLLFIAFQLLVNISLYVQG
jgi:hypothetical protein